MLETSLLTFVPRVRRSPCQPRPRAQSRVPVGSRPGTAGGPFGGAPATSQADKEAGSAHGQKLAGPD
jgi:hypothetical protein